MSLIGGQSEARSANVKCRFACLGHCMGNWHSCQEDETGWQEMITYGRPRTVLGTCDQCVHELLSNSCRPTMTRRFHSPIAAFDFCLLGIRVPRSICTALQEA